MAGKGSLDVKMDAGLLAKVTMFANRYTQDVGDLTAKIKAAARSMQEEESLKGGEGDTIRELFAQIAAGCKKIEDSNKYIADKLNEKLKQVIAMNKNTTSGSAEDALQKANKKAGVLAGKE